MLSKLKEPLPNTGNPSGMGRGEIWLDSSKKDDAVSKPSLAPWVASVIGASETPASQEADVSTTNDSPSEGSTVRTMGSPSLNASSASSGFVEKNLPLISTVAMPLVAEAAFE